VCWKLLWPGEKLLFKAGRGKSIYRSMDYYLRKACKEAGLSKEEIEGVLHFHGFRHLFSSNVDAAGVPRADLKRALGHSRIDRDDQTTSGYIHATNHNRAFEEAERALALLMPAEITPLEEAMTLARTGYQRLTPGERRLYLQQYKQKRRLALAGPADNTRTNQD
jgi:hypothetical protein